MAKYNIIAKTIPNKEYIITEMIATKSNKKLFKELQEKYDYLKEYKFIDYKDTDFTWWGKITKLLTIRKDTLFKNITFNIKYCYFDIDFYGNITKY